LRGGMSRERFVVLIGVGRKRINFDN